LQVAGFRLQIAHCKSEFHLSVLGICCKLSQEIMVVGSYYNIVALMVSYSIIDARCTKETDSCVPKGY